MNKPWADKPYPLITTPIVEGVKASAGSIYVSTTMTLAHNLMIRYLNSIYLQATGITQSDDIAAFLFYCRAFCQLLHEHHRAEEEGFFPMIEEYTGKKGIMDREVEQHKAFDSSLHLFEQYVSETQPEDYSGSKLRTLIDEFAPALLKHLYAEVSSLISVGEEFGGDQLRQTFDGWEKELVKESQAKADPHIMIPAGFGCVDHAFEDGRHARWPPFPWFVPYLNQFIFSRKHAKAWQFSPCWKFQPRELSFVAEDWKDTKAFVETINIK